MVKKILVFLAAFFILVPNSYALYLRLHMPVSTSGMDVGCTLNSIDYDCTPKSSGNSVRGIFGLFGIGYASTTFDHGFDSSANMETTAKANAYDLSLSLLDAMITAGVGTITGGEFTAKQTGRLYQGYCCLDREFSSDSVTGSTSFLNLGFGLGPLELIVGYRIWDLKYSNIKGTITGTGVLSSSSNTFDIDDEVVKYNETTLGIGVGF